MSLGVIGGLGPMATACFMELVINMTKAECDQEHLEMLVYNCPQIPDRTNYILGKSDESPLPLMIEKGKLLKEQGVSCIAIPCITAHYFHRELEEGCGVKIIHAISETVGLLKKWGIERAGLMATDGTIESGIFQRELEAQGIKAVLPLKEKQELVMSIIYDEVKKGKEPDLDKLYSVKEHLLKEGGAQVVILGCTELSVLNLDYELGANLCDCLEVLAARSVVMCGKELNPQYEDLI